MLLNIAYGIANGIGKRQSSSVARAGSISRTDIENPLDGLLGYQLRRASAVMFAGLANVLEDLTLKPTDASVLLLIAANTGITQSEIGRTLAIKRANMAPIAANLVARGLIERMRPDGRSQGLNLSQTGQSLAAIVRQRIERHEARYLADLLEADRAVLTAVVRRIWSDVATSHLNASLTPRLR